MRLNPPSWKALRIGAAVLAVMAAWLMAIAGPSWTGILEAALFGYASGAVVNYTQVIAMQAHYERLQEILNQVQALNGELIEALRHTDAYDRFIDQQNDPDRGRLH